MVGDASTPLSWSEHDGASPLVVAQRAEGKANEAMLKVSNKTDRQLKYDLYISPDGERFQYTSSCILVPNGGGFEMWPYAVHSFAIGRVRDASWQTCE